MIYELGTGELMGMIDNLFECQLLEFSSDSKYLSICSSSGMISIWQVNPEIY